MSSSENIAVEYTGLRHGEKMHEALFSDGEPDLRPVQPLLSHVLVPPMPPSACLALDATLKTEARIANLQAECQRIILSHILASASNG